MTHFTIQTMQYVGGKQAIGKQISEVLQQFDESKGQCPYYEPFCGALSIMKHMPATRIRVASDIHYELIEMWKALQNGWIPPTEISEEEYTKMKYNYEEGKPELRAFVGHAYGYGASYFATFIPKFGDIKRKCGERAKKGVMNAIEKCQDVLFFCADYRDVKLPTTPRMLIYCDPPYEVYSKKVGHAFHFKFDTKQFWDWVREQSKYHMVIVSETQAPKDFIKIWSKTRATTFNTRLLRKKQQREECLFIHESLLKDAKGVVLLSEVQGKT